MPQNTNINLPAGIWTELTNSNVANIRVQPISGYEVMLKATVGAVAPSTAGGAIHVKAGAIIPANYSLAELWPGVVGANRVYAMAVGDTIVSVSHV